MLRGASARLPVLGLARAELDIRDRSAVREAIERSKPGIVINAAGYTSVDRAESDAEAAFAVNRDGAGNLASACGTSRIPLLHISTDYVFDGRKSGAYLEDDATAPLGVYGASKLAGEESVRARLEEHVILRTSWVFSAHGANFLKTILRLARERPTLKVVRDQEGGPTPAGAIAEALLAIAAAVDRGERRWGTYHLCGAPATSWYGFASAILEAGAKSLGRSARVIPITTAEYPLPARRPFNSVLDCAKIKRAFGIGQPDWRGSLPAILATLEAQAKGS